MSAGRAAERYDVLDRGPVHGTGSIHDEDDVGWSQRRLESGLEDDYCRLLPARGGFDDGVRRVEPLGLDEHHDIAVQRRLRLRQGDGGARAIERQANRVRWRLDAGDGSRQVERDREIQAVGYAPGHRWVQRRVWRAADADAVLVWRIAG